MSLFGRPRVESRVFVRALPVMPDQNEQLISYVPTIQSYTGSSFFKKKKRRNHSRFGCRLTSTLPFFLLHGSPAGHSPGRPLALVHTLASVMWLPCSSSPPPSHQSDPVGARAAPSSQLHVKMRVRHKSCYHPRTIPPDVCHVNKNPWKAPNLAWSRPGTFPNFFVWSSFGKVRLPQVTG